MRFSISFIVIFFVPLYAISQVGIGTTTPNAQLEIKSTNQATPANTDGILIPKVDEFPATAPTASQDGMMVYVTGSGTPSKGYYYWNNATTSWVVFSGVKDHDFYKTGTTTQPTDITDDIYTMGNMAIGKNTANYLLDIKGGGNAINIELNSNTNANKGVDILINETSGSIVQFGIRSVLSGSSDGIHYGISNLLSGTGDGEQRGIINNISATGNGKHYGMYNIINGEGSGVHYGVRNFFNGNSATGEQRAISNEFNMNTSTTQYAIYNDNYSNGNGQYYGVYTKLSGHGSGSHFGNYNELTDSPLAGGNGTHFGTYNKLTSTGTGIKYGSYNNIVSSAGGTHYGVYSSVLKSGSYAGYFLGNVSIGTTTANNYRLPASRGIANQVMQTDGSGSLSWVDASALGTDKNTLDQAYDEGGAGAGRTITTTDGAVTIAGEDGFLVTGTIGSGDVVPSGAGTKMFFNPRKAAFRAGIVNGTQWDDASIGDASTAIGWNTIASGQYSTAIGYETDATGTQSIAIGVGATASGEQSVAMVNATASGSYSTAIGPSSHAFSYAEVAFGTFNTAYTPADITYWDAADRLFVIGNGTGNTNRSNALTIYKNGLVNINDEYNMPLTDGTTNQVMKTNGSGDLSWVNASSLINGLLRADGNNWPTTGAGVEIAYANGIGLGYIQSYDRGASNWKDLEISANEINLKTNNTSRVIVQNDGKVKILVASDASGTAGTGSLEIANSLRIDNNEIITNQNTILLLQNDNNGDLAVDGLTLYVDSSANRVGFQTLTPSTDLHLKQSDNLQAGGGGFTFESALANLNWKIYHSGSALSFAENGVRRAYISAATGVYVQTSDRTLKKNIMRVEDDVLSKLSEIEVYRYHYLDQNPSDEKTLGVMAQEIQVQFPELVTTGEDGKLGMNYGGLSVVAIKAIKEQQIEIENQRNEIKELKKLVEQFLEKK